MKKIIVLLVLFSAMLFSCSQKEKSVKLEKGTPAYQLGVDISTKLAYLDPEKNEVLASSSEFDITAGEVLETIQTNFGARADQLKSMDINTLNRIMKDVVQNLADKKILLTAAKKGGSKVAETEIDSLLNQQYLRAGSKEKFMEYLAKAGMDIEYVRNDMRDALTIQHFLDTKLADETNVTEEEIKEVYNQDQTASVRHILLSTQGKNDSLKQEVYKKMEGILARAKKGEDFAKLAKTYTEDPGSKENGGLYEDFGRGAMVPPFDKAAFSVPVGEISDIVETQYGYHILQIVNRKKDTRPFEEVRAELEGELKRNKQNAAYETYIDNLKTETGFKLTEF
ncbi:MAG: peptidylprolyl isomerase [Calditrichaceae bacterium]